MKIFQMGTKKITKKWKKNEILITGIRQEGRKGKGFQSLNKVILNLQKIVQILEKKLINLVIMVILLIYNLLTTKITKN